MRRKTSSGFTLLELALSVGIGALLIAASVWQFKSHAYDAKVGQSRMMLATVRAGITKIRYTYGTLPSQRDMWRNWYATRSVQIVDIATSSPIKEPSALELVTNYAPIMNGVLYEPMSGKATITTVAVNNTGGWYYDLTTGNLQVNLTLPPEGNGLDPSKW